MKQSFSFGFLGALALLGAGCAANPLVADWDQTLGSSGFTFTETLHLGGDGTASFALTGTGSCTGSQTYQGITWSSSDMTVTFSGTASCSGSVTCSVGGQMVTTDCTSATQMGPMNGACTYTLSNDNNTLTLSNCSGSTSGAQTFTRHTGS